MSDHHLLLLGVAEGALILLAQLAVMLLKLRIYQKVMASQDAIAHMLTAAAERDERARQAAEQQVQLLNVIKGWAEIGTGRLKDAAAHHQEAAAKLEQAAAIDAGQPTRADLAQAVAEVPGKTADAVVEKLSTGDGMR